MTINRTTLLDLPLPVTGTESGTWGDITNNGLSQYVDIAVAGMNALTSVDFTAGALTLSNSQGDSGGTNIAAGSAQYATIKTSSLVANSTITAPSSDRSYRIVNADSTYSLTIKASGQTGVTFLPGTTGLVAFNGTDYEVVGVVGAASATDNAIPKFDGTTGQIIQNTGVTIDDSNNVSGVAQLNATTADLTNIEVTNIKAKDGTAAGSIADSTGVVTLASSVLTTTDINGGTIDGTAIGGASAAAGTFTTLNTSGAVVFNDAGANVDFRVEGDTEANLLFVDAGNDRVGIGTSSPTDRLEVAGVAVAGSAAGGTTGSLVLRSRETVDFTRLSIGSLRSSGASYFGYAVQPSTTVANGFNGGFTGTTGVGAWVISSDGSTRFESLPSGATTKGSAVSMTEHMRIDSAGNVGIGTSTSGNLLQIDRSTSLSSTAITNGRGTLYLSAITNSTNSVGQILNAIGFSGQGTGRRRAMIANLQSSSSSTSGGDLAFYTSSSAAGEDTVTERMRITAVGNLLVGTTSVSGVSSASVTAGVFYGTQSVAGNTCLQAWNQATSGDNVFVLFYTEGGGGTLRGLITYNRAGGLTAYNTTSDYRAKDITGPVTGSGALIDSVPV
jgi:hypothetical protein